MAFYKNTSDFRRSKAAAYRFYREGGVRGSVHDPGISTDEETRRAADVAYYDFLGGYGKLRIVFEDWKKTQDEWRAEIRKAVQESGTKTK